MELTPEQINDMVWAGWTAFWEEGPPPWPMRVTIAAIDAYFASLTPPAVEETDIDDNILETLKALPSLGPIAKFDAEGKFSYN